MRLAKKWGLQEADAVEIVQETLLAISKSVGSFQHQESGSFRRWLATIARNKWVDHLKRHDKFSRGTGDSNVQRWLDQQAIDEGPESIWDWNKKREIFAWAAKTVKTQVSEQTWMAFYRTAIRDESIQLVAADLNIHEGQVYVARSRVMSRLKKIVDRWMRQQCEANHEV